MTELNMLLFGFLHHQLAVIHDRAVPQRTRSHAIADLHESSLERWRSHRCNRSLSKMVNVPELVFGECHRTSDLPRSGKNIIARRVHNDRCRLEGAPTSGSLPFLLVAASLKIARLPFSNATGVLKSSQLVVARSQRFAPPSPAQTRFSLICDTTRSTPFAVTFITACKPEPGAPVSAESWPRSRYQRNYS